MHSGILLQRIFKRRRDHAAFRSYWAVIFHNPGLYRSRYCKAHEVGNTHPKALAHAIFNQFRQDTVMTPQATHLFTFLPLQTVFAMLAMLAA